jgi:hypothetical protein
VLAVDEAPESLLSLVTFVNAHSSFDLLLLQVTSYPVEHDRLVIIPRLHGLRPPGTAPTAPLRDEWPFDRATIVEAAQARGSSLGDAVAALFDYFSERAASGAYEIRPVNGKPGFRVGIPTPGGWVLLCSEQTSDGRVWFRPADVGKAFGEQARE